jgi:lipopolysaccharide/colanic/teichoic acid biosynthesis glycosyltransferase
MVLPFLFTALYSFEKRFNSIRHKFGKILISMSIQLFPKSTPLVKRLLDIIITIPSLIILSPILILISFLVAIWHGFPILFRQKRPGYKGKIFTIYKFRTMQDLYDKSSKPLSDEKRLTKLGAFLRSTSLDELPELFNVIKGEMSLVGPRPLLIAYLPLYNQRQLRRHDVLPGITGWAQIHGRNALSWPEKFDLDIWYVDHQSFWLDIKILALTLFKVLTREGISQPGQATADLFMGNSPESSHKNNEK